MKVVDLLQERKLDFKVSGRDYLVKCLNPDHEDKNPSMRIDNITGVYNCFSCGFKGNLFKLFGAPSNYLDVKRQRLTDAIEEKRSSSVGLPFPKGYTPYVGNWRSIKPESYKHFDAFLHHETQFVGRVVFPIRDITGKVVAFNGRHMTLSEKLKGRAILVEGIFDMLNLFDKGLSNVICCFGTNNVDSDKLSILKMQDIMGVDIIFDGDDPGQKAAENVKILAERAGLITRNVNLGQNVDPGSLTEQQVKNLGERLYG
jgi:DNA primase